MEKEELLSLAGVVALLVAGDSDVSEDRPKFKVSDKPLDGYHHLGRLVASMKNYEV